MTSPRIPDDVLARRPDTGAARPHTAAELATVVALLRRAGAGTVAVGHGRDPASVAAALALQEMWTAMGGTVYGPVDWPATAASWLRPARRLTAGDPDAWVLADGVPGAAQVLRRLAQQPSWSAARTVGFAALADDDLGALASPVRLAGMTGATATGGTWWVDDDGAVRVHEQGGGS